MPKNGLTRRHFFYGTLLAGAIPTGGYGTFPSLKALGYKSPNEKLNVAAIGAGGRPFSDTRVAAQTENVVALADVDWERGQPGFDTWPNAARYRDFRSMLDKSGNDIDAVVIGTSDHMHAYCALACMQMGKHIYVEKPLTRTSWEARMLTKAAEKYPNVATQMGNQGYSHDATRVATEIIWSGEIGDVTEVHAWRGRASWPQGMPTTPPPTPVPESLNWDAWLGGAEWREFTEGDQQYWDFVAKRSGDTSAPQERPEYGYYLPFNWRGFYDFGSGLIGDWGIHILGPANWALRLAPEHLISVECTYKDSLPPTTFPDYVTLKYEFAARDGMPPVTVYWYNAEGEPYLPPGMTAEDVRQIDGTGPEVGPPRGGGPGGGGFGGGAPRGGPAGAAPRARGGGGGQGEQRPVRTGYNCIFAGTKGYLGTNGRGEGVGLIPGSRWADYELPPAYLARAPGASTGSNGSAHVRDWIRACKGGAPACSNFSIAGPFTEWLVAGAAALHAEGPCMWYNEAGQFSNNREINRWVVPTYRPGWELRL